MALWGSWLPNLKLTQKPAYFTPLESPDVAGIRWTLKIWHDPEYVPFTLGILVLWYTKAMHGCCSINSIACFGLKMSIVRELSEATITMLFITYPHLMLTFFMSVCALYLHQRDIDGLLRIRLHGCQTPNLPRMAAQGCLKLAEGAQPRCKYIGCPTQGPFEAPVVQGTVILETTHIWGAWCKPLASP